MMKRIFIITQLIVAFTYSLGWGEISQTVAISSSPNPVGSGARALGMGGAFIGVADDATAASWNPAGLIQLETPEVSLVVAYNYRKEDTTYQAFTEASGPQTVSTFDINYLSLAYPFTAFNRNMIVSLNYQHLFDFNKKVNYGSSRTDTVGLPLSVQENISYDQHGAFTSISPAVAVQVIPNLSLGLTLNIWEQGLHDNKWKSKYSSQGSGTFVGFPFDVRTNIDEDYTMHGFGFDLLEPGAWRNLNFNLGLMWNITSNLTLGAVFKSPFEAGLTHEYRFQSTLTFPTNPVSNTYNEIQRSEKVTLDMPMAYGIGWALRLSDQLTLGFDVYQTKWSDYVLHDAEGNELNPITGKLQSDSKVKDTTQVRMGGEYLFLIKYKYIIPVRAGFFYDPEPADRHPDDFFGFSLGTGIAYKQFVFDIAYQFRFGRNVRTTTVGGEDSSQDVDQHTVYTSLIYHF